MYTLEDCSVLVVVVEALLPGGRWRSRRSPGLRCSLSSIPRAAAGLPSRAPHAVVACTLSGRRAARSFRPSRPRHHAEPQPPPAALWFRFRVGYSGLSASQSSEALFSSKFFFAK